MPFTQAPSPAEAVTKDVMESVESQLPRPGMGLSGTRMRVPGASDETKKIKRTVPQLRRDLARRIFSESD